MTDTVDSHSYGEIELAGTAGDDLRAAVPPFISVPDEITRSQTESQRLEQLREQSAQPRAGPRNSDVAEDDDESLMKLTKEDDGPAVCPPLKSRKWLPLVVFAAFVATITTLSLVLTRRTNTSRDTAITVEDDDEKLITADAEEGTRCLWQLNNQFLGTDAFRLEFGAPQLKATEWLAVHDRACSNMDAKSDQMEQRYALVVLYFAMGGKGWGLSGWAQPNVFECDWQNVGCNLEKQVTDLNLGQKTNGQHLPEEIGLLSSLTNLDLSWNNIRGTIPKALYSLTNLVLLELGLNQFAGSIDTGIGSLVDLELLDLSRNLLTGILPSSLGSLTRLKSFNIEENAFLEGELLSIIPSWPNLEKCIGIGTKISGTIPTEIGNLSSLYWFDLDSTAIFGTIPTEIGLISLRFFSAISAPFDGSLPSEIGQLSLLETFKIRDTNMFGTTIPTEFGLCTSLVLLYLGDSGLTSTIPSELGLLSGLKEFLAEENRLTGSIPVEFHRLSNLEILDLSLNAGIEPVPSTLCDVVQQTLRVDCEVECPQCCDRTRC